LNIAKGEAEETKRGLLKSARKKFVSELVAKNIADKYTAVLKGTTAYIKFLQLNELENNCKKSRLKNQNS
jgi:hypothetical protein